MRRLDLDAVLGRVAPDRLSVLALGYLLLPLLVFLGGFLRWPLGVGMVALALLGAAASTGWRAAWPLGTRATLACLLGGLFWAFGATGTHHLLYAAVDWQIRDSVLEDLARGGWPVSYVIGDLAWLLRAPLGYYLVPALAGPLLARAALFAWTAAGLAVVLLLLAATARDAGLTRRGAVWLTAIFVSFGGLDLLPNLWLDAHGAGIASYLGRGGEWWARDFQYSGHATLLLWVPNHALPGWIPALLAARHGRTPGYARRAGLVLVAAASWGPLSAVGAAVVAAAAILGRGGAGPPAALGGLPNWCAAILAVPLAMFLTAGSAAIPHGWLVAREGWGAIGTVALFLLVELAVAIPLLRLIRWWLLVPSLVLLAILPLYEFGPGNEMTMRGGIAPLTLLALAAGIAWASVPRGGWRWLLGGILLVGALGQAMEASILINRPWPATQGCTLPEAAAQSVFTDTDWSHYVVPWPDARLVPILAEPAAREVGPETVSRCWPDQR
ncbi:hypothetical protein [Falsiroseomonas sp. HW251]|uniref:hypothetical protein n=1 Tax=Falsiroseomonas sp. HW251 TaxID=3390998 RepID=UPI003D318BB9